MTHERPPIATVGTVRDELRRLGYLDSGLDRFLLGSAGGASALRASLGVSLRVGVVGGALLGVGITLAAVGLDRRLLSEPRDLSILLLYVMFVAGIATALAAFFGGLAAASTMRRLGRRPGSGVARNVGVAVGLVGLVYLGLWWRSHAANAPWPSQGATVVLGVILCALLGRFGSLAAVAVLSTGGVEGRLPQARFARRRMLVLLAVAGALFGGVVGAATYATDRAAAVPPEYAVVPTGLRVRVLGIDGLDGRMAEQMIQRGQMPRLAALLLSSARGRLQPEPQQVPAIVWTTIATGRDPSVHGVQATGFRRLAGMKTPVPLSAEPGPFASALARAADLLRITRAQPATSVLRGGKTFWSVASEKGLRVGVVNWWATWPAETLNGYVVSDRTFFKIEKQEPPDRDVHPAGIFDRVRVPASPSGMDRALRLDAFYVKAAQSLRLPSPPDIEAVYLPGLDILTMQEIGEDRAPDLPGLDARLDAVRESYRVVDGVIGRWVDDLGANDVLLVVADPGRLARRGSGAEGILVVAGAASRPADLGAVSERDVAPTVLHLAGLPISRELDGRVLESALTTEFRHAHPIRFVSTYGRRPITRAAESAFDREMVEQLRSLGYLK